MAARSVFAGSMNAVDRDESLGSRVALSPDGLHLGGISPQGVLQVFDFKTLKPKSSALPFVKDNHDWMHRRLAWSPKGDQIAVSSGFERTVWLVNASSGEIVWTKTELPVNAYRSCELDWSPDGSQLAIVANADAILLLDGATGDLRATWKLPQLATYSGGMRGIVWSPDGTVVCATAFSPEKIGLLDPKTGTVRRTIEGNLNRVVMSLAWFGDESTLVADIPGGGTMTRFWKVPTLEVVPSAHDLLGYRAPGGQAGLNGK